MSNLDLFQTFHPENHMARIEAARKKLGVSIETLCREACISTRGYYFNLKQSQPRGLTVQRLERALENLKERQERNARRPR